MKWILRPHSGDRWRFCRLFCLTGFLAGAAYIGLVR